MNDFGHFTAIVGNSGSGKTACFMMQQVKQTIENNQSFVLTDCKNEAFQYIGEDLKRNNYNITVLNFRGKDSSIFWNPLYLPYKYFRDNELEQCYQLLNGIAESIFNQGKKVDADPFWDISARDFFVGLAFALFEDATSVKQINLMSIYSMAMAINDKIGTSNYLQKYLETKENRLGYAISCTYGTVSAPSDTRSSIMSVFFQKLRYLIMNEKYRSILCNNDIDIMSDLQKKTVFIIQYEDEIEESAFVAKIFIQQIINLLINERANGDKKYKDFNIFFEDFLLLRYFSNIDTLLLSAKERKINLMFCINNLALLEKVYGQHTSSALLENCEKIVFTSFRNKESLKYITTLLGQGFSAKDIPDNRALCIYNHHERELLEKKCLEKQCFHVAQFKIWKEKKEIEVFQVKNVVKEKMMSVYENEIEPLGRKNSVDDLIRRIDQQIEKLENEQNKL